MDAGIPRQLLDRLDTLLGRLLPGSPLSSPACSASAQEHYEYLEAARLRLGEVLAADPALTTRLADDVLPLLALDGNLTSQLVFPLTAALGRRPVLTHLVAQARTGSWQTRTNACSAAYWVSAWRPTAHRDAIITATRQGALPVEQARTLLQHDRQHPDWRLHDHITDLWPHLWTAAVEAFVHCRNDELRQRLQTVFPLAPAHYPSDHGPLLYRARLIAEEKPHLFGRLLAHRTGYSVAI
ncbi:hypothetical protein KNE206_61470 [Kitasatospora sp. NE20-6]|uniref:hypothetical protein n=1 Tax=Kitasatospora sp. NE20-6 TaxID=2859066 RepID=UPI0034DBC92C